MAEKHKNIYTALAAAQAEIGRALKDAENPHFRSKYADLASVMDACMSALNKNGIAVVQPVEFSELGEQVRTILYHGESETSAEGAVPLLLGKRDMQGLGSAITYARRYGLMTMAGVAADDDDGNAAVSSAPNRASEALKDAWTQSVLDALPENAGPQEKAEAFADAICAEFEGKGERALGNRWEKHKGLIGQLESRFPDLHEKVTDAYLSRQNEILDEKAANDGNRMETAE